METLKIPHKRIFCGNCNAPIKLLTNGSGYVAVCKCRVRQVRILHRGFAIDTEKLKLSFSTSFAVVTDGRGQVNLVNSEYVISLNSKLFAIYFNSDDKPILVGLTKWLPDIPFIKQLINYPK